MPSGPWTRFAGLTLFLMIFTASCQAIGVNPPLTLAPAAEEGAR